MKKPAAQLVHDVAPPIEYLPATQSAQAASAISVPPVEMNVPAAQYVWVVHEATAVAEYLPLAQSVHAMMVPPLPLFPATQSAQFRSLVVVHAAVWYLPAAHVAQLAHPVAPAAAL